VTDDLFLSHTASFTDVEVTWHPDGTGTGGSEVRTPTTSACMARMCIQIGKNNCARCKWAYYCSRTCQTENWKTHKLLCKPCNQPELELIRKGYQAALTYLHGKLRGFNQEVHQLKVWGEGADVRCPVAHKAWLDMFKLLKDRIAEPGVQHFFTYVQLTHGRLPRMLELREAITRDPILGPQLDKCVRTFVEETRSNRDSPPSENHTAAVRVLLDKHNAAAADVKTMAAIVEDTLIRLGAVITTK
jgi:hypothetical protein